jgi:hypothetical protein
VVCSTKTKIMKRFFSFIACLFVVGQLYSASWRVNNYSQIDSHFKSLAAAIADTNVLPDDTLYLENGTYFGGVTLNKRLVIIGPGFFLAEIDSSYAYPSPAIVNSISIMASGAGSKLIGLQILNTLGLDNGANNILIERCYFPGLGSSYPITGLTVRGCYITGQGISSSHIQSAIIHNNIIVSMINLPNSNGSFNIYNNVIIYTYTGSVYSAVAVRNSNFSNNVVIREPISYKDVMIDFSNSQNTNFTKNVFNCAPIASIPNNYFDAVKTDIFTFTGSTDAKYKLKAGSPAIGYGTNGDDCGAYGGATPYVSGGLPYLIPRIIQATIPGNTSGNTLPVQMRIVNQEE